MRKRKNTLSGNIAYLQANNLPIPTSAFDDFFASQEGLDYILTHMDLDEATNALVATGWLKGKSDGVLVAMEELEEDLEVGGIAWHEAAPLELSDAEKQEAWDVLLQSNNSFSRVDQIAGRYVTDDSFGGRVVLGLFHRNQFWDQNNRRDFAKMAASVMGVPELQLYGVLRQTGSRFEQGLVSLFSEYGFGYLFKEQVLTGPQPASTKVHIMKEEYENESIRVMVDTTAAGYSYLHFDLYIVDAATGKQIWKKQLNGITQNQLYTNVAMEEIGALTGIPLKIMGVAWFDEKYVDENGHEQNVHVANMSETFSIKWGGETAELPAANRQIIDYLHNEVLPTLNPVYGADGSVVEWEASESSGLSCKEWVQKTVAENAFEIPKDIPQNDKFDSSKWLSGGDVSEVSSMNNDFTDTKIAEEYFTDAILSGDLIQAKIKYTSGGTGPHTFIIDQVTENGVWVFDSNWHSPEDNVVRKHFFTFEYLSSNVIALTTYRLNP